MDAGKGTMKGAGFMSGDMGPILARHLKETLENKGNRWQQMILKSGSDVENKNDCWNSGGTLQQKFILSDISHLTFNIYIV